MGLSGWFRNPWAVDNSQDANYPTAPGRDAETQFNLRLTFCLCWIISSSRVRSQFPLYVKSIDRRRTAQPMSPPNVDEWVVIAGKNEDQHCWLAANIGRERSITYTQTVKLKTHKKTDIETTVFLAVCLPSPPRRLIIVVVYFRCCYRCDSAPRLKTQSCIWLAILTAIAVAVEIEGLMSRWQIKTIRNS